MIFTPTPLDGSYLIDLEPFADERGWFARFYCKEEFEAIQHDKEWVQLNHSATYQKGSIRGMHFQLHPYKEIKMVRCVVGSVFDVIIDLRSNSPSFLQWVGAELSANNKRMMYIPRGFAHGFQTLENNCELIYHHTEIYKPEAERGLRYNDPRVGIRWPLPLGSISKKDSEHPFLEETFKGI